MNAKICKRLRRQARGLTIGRSDTEYRRGSHVDQRSPSRKVLDGIEVLFTCTRGVYRQLKRNVRMGIA